MKAQINLTIKKIKGIKISPEVIKNNPEIIEKTNNTLNAVCSQIKQFFKTYKIEVIATHDLKG